MLRKILTITIVCIGILSMNSVAMAGINEGSVNDSLYSFGYTLGWNPEEIDSWSFTTGDYWTGSLDIEDGDTTWDVTWSFQHLDEHADYSDTLPYLHDGYHDPNTVNNTLTASASFDKASYGLVIDEEGWIWHEDPALPHVEHPDDWTFEFDRNADPALTTISLQVVHAPEPISSTLFLVGAATLGFRRFRKTRMG